MATRGSQVLPKLSLPATEKELSYRRSIRAAVVAVVIHKQDVSNACVNNDIQQKRAIKPYVNRFQRYTSETSLYKDLSRALAIGEKRLFTDDNLRQALKHYCHGPRKGKNKITVSAAAWNTVKAPWCINGVKCTSFWCKLKKSGALLVYFRLHRDIHSTVIPTGCRIGVKAILIPHS